MMAAPEDLVTRVLELSRGDRLMLTERLISSLDDDVGDHQQKWVDLAKERYQEVLDGRVETIPSEVAFARARNLIQQRE